MMPLDEPETTASEARADLADRLEIELLRHRRPPMHPFEDIFSLDELRRLADAVDRFSRAIAAEIRRRSNSS